LGIRAIEKNNLPLPETFEMNSNQIKLASHWPMNGSIRVTSVDVFKHKGEDVVSEAMNFYFSDRGRADEWVSEYSKRVDSECGPLFISIVLFPPQGKLVFKDFYSKDLTPKKADNTWGR
jgi:hypothetical protein